MLTSEVHLHGAFWDAMANFDINLAGFAIAGLFLVVWAAALLYWRLGRVEARWTSGTVVPDSGQERDPHDASAGGSPTCWRFQATRQRAEQNRACSRRGANEAPHCWH